VPLKNSVKINGDVEQVSLTEELKDFIKIWKSKPGNLIMVLHQVQEHFGYIPRSVAFEVASLLNVPVAKIFGVISFYHFFNTVKPGRNKISVCLGTACYLKGSGYILEEFARQLNVEIGGTTADGEFTLEAVRCVGCCGLAPVITFNGEVVGRVSTKDVDGIIEKYMI
jgi:NADH-quinone oxidoreductase subunit E